MDANGKSYWTLMREARETRQAIAPPVQEEGESYSHWLRRAREYEERTGRCAAACQSIGREAHEQPREPGCPVCHGRRR